MELRPLIYVSIWFLIIGGVSLFVWSLLPLPAQSNSERLEKIENKLQFLIDNTDINVKVYE